MTNATSKETAELAPSVWQGLRSAAPYLQRTKEAVRGTISAGETPGGNQFVAYLPPAYGGVAEVGDYPVLYHLHGAGVRWSWVQKDIHWIAAAHERAVADGVVEPMIIVGAYDPTHFSMWADSLDGTTKMASAVLDDLLPHIEATFRVRGDRASRFLQGFSMGGFGAAHLGLRHQDVFAAVIIWDGAMHDWRTINEGRAKIAERQFGRSEAYFEQWSPWAAAEQADLARTPVLIVAGLMEDYNRRFRDHLAALGGRVTFESVGCLHDVRCLLRTHGRDAFAFLGGL